MNHIPSPWDEIPGVGDPPKTYHVWLTGETEPEVIQAYEASERNGELSLIVGMQFDGPKATLALRRFQPNEWFKWSIVHDEADHGI